MLRLLYRKHAVFRLTMAIDVFPREDGHAQELSFYGAGRLSAKINSWIV